MTSVLSSFDALSATGPFQTHRFVPGESSSSETQSEKFMRAIQKDDLRAADSIFEAGDVDLKECISSNQRPAAHIAARNGQLNILQWLARHGQDLHARHEDLGDTALHMAAWSGNLNAAKYLCSDEHDKCANFNDLPGFIDGKTAGHIAIERGHEQFTRWLFSNNGCDWHMADAKGRTPISLLRSGLGTKMHSADTEENVGLNARDQPGKQAHMLLRMWANTMVLRTTRNEELATAAVADLQWCVREASCNVVKEANDEAFRGPLSATELNRSMARWYPPGRQTVLKSQLTALRKATDHKASW